MTLQRPHVCTLMGLTTCACLWAKSSKNYCTDLDETFREVLERPKEDMTFWESADKEWLYSAPMFDSPLAQYYRKITARRNVARIWMKFSGKVRINGKKKILDFGSIRTNNDSIAPPCLWPLWYHIVGKVQHVFWWNFHGWTRITHEITDLFLGVSGQRMAL